MKQSLTPGEYVLADSGYTENSCVRLRDTSVDTRVHELLPARHETVNQRLNNFNILATRYRHNLSQNSFCFHVIINIVHLFTEHEDSDSLFTVAF